MSSNSYLLNGDDGMGMTDNQYKGMLIDQLRNWKHVLELAIVSGNADIQKLAEEQIEDLNAKLKF